MADQESQRQRAFEEGYREMKLEIAKRMLQRGMEVQQISELTGLAIEELKAHGFLD